MPVLLPGAYDAGTTVEMGHHCSCTRSRCTLSKSQPGQRTQTAVPFVIQQIFPSPDQEKYVFRRLPHARLRVRPVTPPNTGVGSTSATRALKTRPYEQESSTLFFKTGRVYNNSTRTQFTRTFPHWLPAVCSSTRRRPLGPGSITTFR